MGFFNQISNSNVRPVNVDRNFSVLNGGRSVSPNFSSTTVSARPVNIVNRGCIIKNQNSGIVEDLGRMLGTVVKILVTLVQQLVEGLSGGFSGQCGCANAATGSAASAVGVSDGSGDSKSNGFLSQIGQVLGSVGSWLGIGNDSAETTASGDKQSGGFFSGLLDKGKDWLLGKAGDAGKWLLGGLGSVGSTVGNWAGSALSAIGGFLGF